VTHAIIGLSDQHRFIRFLLVGGFAAGVNLAVRYLLNFLIDYSTSIVLAYLIGMLTAFGLSKWLVFERSGLGTRIELIRFGLINLVAIAQVWVVSVVLAEGLFPRIGIETYRYDIAHVIGVAMPALTSYLGHKHYSFAARKARGQIRSAP
jgi:putative flippase GtrA